MSRSIHPPNKPQRLDLAAETHGLTPDVIRATGALTGSHLYRHLLPRTPEPPNQKTCKITVCNSDSFTAAETILRGNPTAKLGVLNMASERNPGGGWLRGALAQEEALCLRSTLAATLHRRHYPLPVAGAIWSPKVTVFRGEVNDWCRIYAPEEMFSVGVLSLAALRRPNLTRDRKQFANPGDIDTVKNKIRQVLRVLAVNNVTHCVLGAMGCGAFQNPAGEIARIYKEVLGEAEWKGVFEEIVFAVLDSRGESNHRIFKNMLDGQALGNQSP